MGDMHLYFQYVSGEVAGPMIAGDAQQLSSHDRMILDVERVSPTPAARRLPLDASCVIALIWPLNATTPCFTV